MTTVLVVDDEHDILYAVKGVLEDEGYEVVACSAGSEALDYLATNRPNLVLMDVMMPYMTGYDVLERIQESPNLEGLPVVMMSAGAPAAAPKGEPRWRAFLKKPFTLDRLIQVVASFAEKTG